MRNQLIVALLVFMAPCFAEAQLPEPAKQIELPTSKVLFDPVPGTPRHLNSFPAASAVSPNGKFVAILNQGWGQADSNFQQSIAILDVDTNKLTDFPDPRLGQKQKQTYFYGLAWSRDGQHLYASIASLTDPEGKLPHTNERGGPGPGAEGDLGNGIAVYRFDGGVTNDRFIPIALQAVPAGKKRAKGLRATSADMAPSFPAGIAVVNSGGSERLLVANDLADNVVEIDPVSGAVVHTFDLSEHDLVPAEFPLNVVASRDGKRAWVSLWNASAIAELDLDTATVVRRIRVSPPKTPTESGSHPTALLLSPDEKRLYCSLSNADSVAVIDTATGRVAQVLSTALPGQQRPGVLPVALAQSADGKTLYVADAAADAIAVFDSSRAGQFQRHGFIPTEWYPSSLGVANGDLIITTAKARGTGPNSRVWEPTTGRIARTNHPYIFALLAGSIARVNLATAEQDIAHLTQEVLRSNRLGGAFASPPWRKNPIRHAIYIIKENRSYDQLFGDIREANGDPSLVMYGEAITPNHHKLARQFGIFDNFYVSGEVSGDGHVWSTAAIGSDYTEATIQINYRNAQRSYDYEGTNTEEVMLEHGLPDVDEPGTGFLWAHAARHRITYRDYGEYIRGLWCTEAGTNADACPIKTIEKGQPLPANVGEPHGSASPYAWKVPVLRGSVATKEELRDHFDPKYAGWELNYPDQLRADEFLNEFGTFVRARQEHRKDGRLPALSVVRLPNDHTSGTRTGAPKPEAQVADNDLALGRIVEAVSHSPYWDDTVIFVLEDDAQNGPDHVDAHRSPALVISKYSRQADSPESTNIDSHFYTTVNMIRTIEEVLGIGPMNHNDAQAVPMWTAFSATASQAPYVADWRNRDNGLLYEVNSRNAPGSEASNQMDFSRADAVDSQVLNDILWKSAKGDVPMPETPQVIREMHHQ